MTWEELAVAQQTAARHLWGTGDPVYQRAVCGRAYYAAYALVTSCLSSSIQFGGGWNNPPHAKLPGYVGNIAGLQETDRREVRRALRRLRQRREDADYRPGITVNRSSARESIRDASQVFAILSARQNHE
jgi:hypothetical protein